MASLKIKNTSGKDAGTVELDPALFGVQPNVPVMHQVVTAQLAARRSGTQSTKTRSDVAGGGAKPYRQKGTGNARQGSIRAPQFTGGGVALGPKPRKYNQKTPKKMIKLALRSALSDRANEGKIVVVDSWGIDAPKTKDAKQALDALGLDGTVLVVVERHDDAAALSFRNLPRVQVIEPRELNAYDVLCNDWIVFTQDVLPATADEAPKQPAAKKAPSAASKKAAAKASDSSAASKKAAEGSASDEAGEDAESTESADLHPHGPKSHAPLPDGSQPEGFPIKGNEDSMLYHTPDSPHYGRTKPEVWFASEAAAQGAGFSKSAAEKQEK